MSFDVWAKGRGLAENPARNKQLSTEFYDACIAAITEAYHAGRILGRQEGAAGMRHRAKEACESIQGRACAELVAALSLDAGAAHDDG